MNNDLISREALKEAIETYDKFAYLPNGKLCPCRDLVELEMYVPYIHFDDVIKAIDNAPTVELFCSYLSDGEVRQPCIEAPCEHEGELIKAYTKGFDTGVETVRTQGKWIYHKGDGYFLPTMECSQCHESDLLGDLTPKLYKEYYKFCFRCGADMRKGGAE